MGELCDDDTAERTIACGTNRNGSQVQSCNGNYWVNESECDNAFVTVWALPETDTEVNLPLVEDGTYDFDVDWGDGGNDHIDSWDAAARSHNYAEAGSYSVTITGQFEGWSMGQLITEEYDFDEEVGVGWSYESCMQCTRLHDVVRFGPMVLGDTRRQFYSTANLKISATDAPGLQQTTSLAQAFAGSGLESSPSLPLWDVSGVTTMESMFSGAASFSGDIGDWDTSNVESMGRMFMGAASFNGDIGDWDTSNVEDMNGMFENAASFNGDIGDWDTSNVESMGRMFMGAASFNGDIGDWDTSSAYTMGGMFWNAVSFNQNIGGWDTSNVDDMLSMFQGASAFDQDIGGWDISNVGYFADMFYEAELSTQNYDALLIGWSAQAVQSDRWFDAGTSTYSTAAASARTRLVDVFSWNINDGGPE